MNFFGKRRSPSLLLAFLLLLSLLLSQTVYWAPQAPPEQQAAQRWLDHSLGWGKSQVRQLQSRPLQLLVVLEAMPEQVERIESGLETLLCLQPSQGEQLHLLVAKVARPWENQLPVVLLLLSLGSYLAALRLKAQHAELKVDKGSLILSSYVVLSLFGLGWAQAAQIGKGRLLLCGLVLLLGERWLRRWLAKDSQVRLTPVRQAAIFLMRMPPEQGAAILKEMGPDQVYRLTSEIVEMPPVGPELGERVERQVWKRIGQSPRRPVDFARAGKVLNQHFLNSSQREMCIFTLPRIRWTVLGLSLLSWLTLASWGRAVSPHLPLETGDSFLGWPLQRHTLETHLSALGMGRIPVFSLTRATGETGVLVCIPPSNQNSAEVWPKLVESGLSQLGLKVERWQVSPPLGWAGPRLSSWLAPLFLILAGWLIHRQSQGNFIRPEMKLEVKPDLPESTPPAPLRRSRRRTIYSCIGCDEVFVDQESLRRHEAVCESYPSNPSPPPPRKLPAERLPAEPVTLTIPASLRIDLGSGFLVRDNFRKSLEFRLTKVGELLYQELGIRLPDCGLSDSPTLGRFAYRICYHEMTLAEGCLQPEHNLAIGPEEKLVQLGGTLTKDPIYGLPGVWWEWGKRREAERLGCLVLDCESVVATHLTEVVRKQPNLFFGYPEFLKLRREPDWSWGSLVWLESNGWEALDSWFLLRGLLRERLSIRNLELVWQALLASPQRWMWQRIRVARLALAPSLCEQLANAEKVIQVIAVDEELDEAVGECLDRSRDWPEFALPKRTAQAYLGALKEPIETLRGRGLQVNLLVSSDSRLAFRLLTEAAYPDVVVLARDEIAPGYRVNPVASVSMPALP